MAAYTASMPCSCVNFKEPLLQGKRYWANERKLCKAMLHHDHTQPATFDLEDIHKTSEAKSFDYRASPCTPHACFGYMLQLSTVSGAATRHCASGHGAIVERAIFLGDA